jgi:hypothetical protein
MEALKAEIEFLRDRIDLLQPKASLYYILESQVEKKQTSFYYDKETSTDLLVMTSDFGSQCYTEKSALNLVCSPSSMTPCTRKLANEATYSYDNPEIFTLRHRLELEIKEKLALQRENQSLKERFLQNSPDVFIGHDRKSFVLEEKSSIRQTIGSASRDVRICKLVASELKID